MTRTTNHRRIIYLQTIPPPRRIIDAQLWCLHQLLSSPPHSFEASKLVNDAAFLFLLPGKEARDFALNFGSREKFRRLVVSFQENGGFAHREQEWVIRPTNPPPFSASTLEDNLNYHPYVASTEDEDLVGMTGGRSIDEIVRLLKEEITPARRREEEGASSIAWVENLNSFRRRREEEEESAARGGCDCDGPPSVETSEADASERGRDASDPPERTSDIAWVNRLNAIRRERRNSSGGEDAEPTDRGAGNSRAKKGGESTESTFGTDDSSLLRGKRPSEESTRGPGFADLIHSLPREDVEALRVQAERCAAGLAAGLGDQNRKGSYDAAVATETGRRPEILTLTGKVSISPIRPLKGKKSNPSTKQPLETSGEATSVNETRNDSYGAKPSALLLEQPPTAENSKLARVSKAIQRKASVAAEEEAKAIQPEASVATEENATSNNVICAACLSTDIVITDRRLRKTGPQIYHCNNCNRDCLRANSGSRKTLLLNQPTADSSNATRAGTAIPACLLLHQPTAYSSKATTSEDVVCTSCLSSDVVMIENGPEVPGNRAYQCKKCSHVIVLPPLLPMQHPAELSKATNPSLSATSKPPAATSEATQEDKAPPETVTCNVCFSTDVVLTEPTIHKKKACLIYRCKKCNHVRAIKVAKKKRKAHAGGVVDQEGHGISKKRPCGPPKEAESFNDEEDGTDNDSSAPSSPKESILEQVQNLKSLIHETSCCNKCSSKFTLKDAPTNNRVEIHACTACHHRFKQTAANIYSARPGQSEQFYRGQEKIITLLRDAHEEVNRTEMEKDRADFLAKMKALKSRLDEKKKSVMAKLNAVWDGTAETVDVGSSAQDAKEEADRDPYQEAILLLRRETPALEKSITRLLSSNFLASEGSNDVTTNETHGQIISLTESYRNKSSDDCYKLASRVVQDDGEELEIYEMCDE